MTLTQTRTQTRATKTGKTNNPLSHSSRARACEDTLTPIFCIIEATSFWDCSNSMRLELTSRPPSLSSQRIPNSTTLRASLTRPKLASWSRACSLTRLRLFWMKMVIQCTHQRKLSKLQLMARAASSSSSLSPMLPTTSSAASNSKSSPSFSSRSDATMKL